MIKKIAILRGINVGGKRKILMADLKALVHDLGYNNCTTYIQSGNIFFETNIAIDDVIIANEIEKAIKEKFSFDVPVIVTNYNDLKEAISHNPFLTEKTDIKDLHLTFLKEVPTLKDIATLYQLEIQQDEFYIYKQFIFLLINGSYHKSKLSNKFFEQKLRVKASTRNWKTVLKLLELSK